MKKRGFALWPIFLIVVVVWPVVALAQRGEGILLVLNGSPDAEASPPEVHVYASVIDKGKARTVEDLSAENFTLEEAGSALSDVRVALEEVGLATVIVVDRGGISKPGDGRIKQATELARAYIDRLSITGAANDDMLAIVGIGKDGVLQPKENFSYNPVDKNLVLNALTKMENETVEGGTPLYEGLDAALEMLIDNPDATIREVLSHRRRVILVFSDGIDPGYSDEARENDIIRKAVEHGISIYTIGMAPGDGGLSKTAESNLKRLASQTYGAYQLHNATTHSDVLALFERVATQRKQYVLRYDTHQPKGSYALSVMVEVDDVSAEEETTFSSLLELPELSLLVKRDEDGDLAFTVPYTRAKEGPALTIQLSVAVAHPDGIARSPEVVRYYADGTQIGESTAAPDFAFEWDVSELEEHGNQEVEREYTLTAEAVDPYLDQSYVAGSPVNVRVTWEKAPAGERVRKEVVRNLWVILVLLAVVIGLVVLLLLLLRTRSEFANRMVKGATGVLKGVTRRLTASPSQAPAKLVIQQGVNIGREYPLVGPIIKVGRDPQFCDFALHDEFVSNPHFSIHAEGQRFFIVDEKSTNGTRLNGVPLVPLQRTPLPPNAVIEVGATKLRFVVRGVAEAVSPGGGRMAGPYATRPVQRPPVGRATRPVQQPPVGGQAPDQYATRPVQRPPVDEGQGQRPPSGPGKVGASPEASNREEDPYATRPLKE